MNEPVFQKLFSKIPLFLGQKAKKWRFFVYRGKLFSKWGKIKY
jgi:hypothetical protein